MFRGLISFKTSKAQLSDLAPRIDIAYSDKSGDTSVRAGLGLPYDNLGILSLPPQFMSKAVIVLG